MSQDVPPLSPQAQLFYQRVTRAAGNVLAVYKAGSLALQRVPAPRQFSELVTRLASDWALPLQQNEHPLRSFLVELDRREPLRLLPEQLRARNLRALCLGYSLISGELRTQVLLERLSRELGPFFEVCASVGDLGIRWSDQADTLIVEAAGRIATLSSGRGAEPLPGLARAQRSPVTAQVSKATAADAPSNAEQSSQTGELRLQDNALGRIERVFVFLTAQLPYRCLLALLSAIPAHFQIVTTPSQAADVLRARLAQDGISDERYTLFSSAALDSRWARDGFLLASRGTHATSILRSTLPLLPGNQRLADDLAAHSHALLVEDVQVPFEGGDLRAIGPRLFVGLYTFQSALNALRRELDTRGSVRIGDAQIGPAQAAQLPALLTRALEALSGRAVELVGELSDGPPPLAHLDTYATFLPMTGNERAPREKPVVLLADTRSALALLSALSEEELAQTERAILLASLDPTELTDSSCHPIYRGSYMAHDLIELVRYAGLAQFIRAFAASEERIAVQARLDTTHAWLTAHGYRVRLTPALLVMHGAVSVWAEKAGRLYLRTLQDHVKRNYNNALIEVFHDAAGQLRRIAYLPQYGFACIEDQLRDIYAEFGYDTAFIPFLWEAAWGAGAVNCLTSEERAPFSAAPEV